MCQQLVNNGLIVNARKFGHCSALFKGNLVLSTAVPAISEPLDLIQMLITRVCHDLAGPLGAVATGVEFLTEAGEADPESLGLIASSSASAVDRLKFLRLALGRAGGNDAANLPAQLGNFLRASQGAQRPVEIDWQLPAEVMADADTVQVLAVMALLAVDGLARVSAIRATLADGAVQLHAEGRPLAESRRAALFAAVSDTSAAPPDPATAAALYAVFLAQSKGCLLVLREVDGGLLALLQENPVD